ncbi:hypothetical protein HDU67_002189 [Dinochytrium kinnereticum]|nr:hypothetical protein HDU67_002189 [Dinochytrium kinnereticum]
MSVVRQVFPTYDMLGWYTVGTKPSKVDVHVHQQFLDFNESPLFLQLNPLMTAVTRDVPISLYESVIDIVDGQPQLKFVASSFTIETGEAERIAVAHVAHQSNADASNESTLISHLSTKRNAIKMLQSRLQILAAYIEDVENGELPRDHAILREISSLRDRLPTMTGSDFKREAHIEYADVLLMTYLTTMTKGTSQLNDLIDKVNFITSDRIRRGGGSEELKKCIATYGLSGRIFGKCEDLKKVFEECMARELLAGAETQLKRFVEYDREYEKLESFLSTVHTSTRIKHKVQLGQLAFMEGELIHTNEVIVSLGDNWFVERSSVEAVEIVRRRREYTKEQIRKAEDNLKELKLKLSLAVGLTDDEGHALNEEGLRFVEIRETEENESFADDSNESKQRQAPSKKDAPAPLGEFEREFLAKLARYEEEEEEAGDAEPDLDEEKDSDANSINSDMTEETSSSSTSDVSDTEPIPRKAFRPSKPKPTPTKPEIRNPADIYNQMKALSMKEEEEELTIGAMKKTVVEKEMDDYTESDLEDYFIQKDIAEDYFRKRRMFFDKNEEDEDEYQDWEDEDGARTIVKHAELQMQPTGIALENQERLLKDMLDYHTNSKVSGSEDLSLASPPSEIVHSSITPKPNSLIKPESTSKNIPLPKSQPTRVMERSGTEPILAEPEQPKKKVSLFKASRAAKQG